MIFAFNCPVLIVVPIISPRSKKPELDPRNKLFTVKDEKKA